MHFINRFLSSFREQRSWEVAVQNYYMRSLVLVLGLVAGSAYGQETPQSSGADTVQWKDLTDDSTRSDLANYEILKYGSAADKAVRKKFVFPANADDGVYGIDVSHHNGQVNWQSAANSGVKFAYIKASQGGQYRDAMFPSNWGGAAKHSIRRGAYHFLTANVDGRQQANAYLAMLKSVGGLQDNDLAPVLDLEWDFNVVNGKKVDRWSSLTPQQIAKTVQEWLSAVEASTGRKPMIYTSASWWNERMQANTDLAKYYQWIADYRTNGAPLTVKKHEYRAWQFTEDGRFEGATSKFDVNKLKGKDLALLMGR